MKAKKPFTLVGLLIGLVAAATGTASPASQAEAAVWSAQGPFEGWKANWHLELRRNAGAMTLFVTGDDSSVVNDAVDIDPSRCDCLEITYRASGIPDKTSGQLYYAKLPQDKFDASRRWLLPSLKGDGRWRVLRLYAGDKNALATPERWFTGGKVSKLRLDMVDQPTGVVEVKSIRLLSLKLEPDKVDLASKYYFPAAAMGVEASLPKARYSVWAFQRDASQPLSAELAKSLVSGILPPEEPTMVQRESGLWTKLGVSTGGKFKLLAPGEGAELLDGILFSTLDTPSVFPAEEKWPAAPSELPGTKRQGASFSGYMIKAPGDTQANIDAGKNVFYLRREFTAPPDLRQAWLQITADDSCELFVNGVLAISQGGEGSWKRPAAFSVVENLRPGKKNLLAISYRNNGGPGGALVELLLRRGDGSVEKIVSDEAFKASAVHADGWARQGFDDSSWQKPILQQAPPTPPWTEELPYLEIPKAAGGQPGNSTLKLCAFSFPPRCVAGDIPRAKMKLSRDTSSLTPRLTVKADDLKGRRLFDFEVPVSTQMFSPAAANGETELAVPVRMPRWLHSGAFQLSSFYADNNILLALPKVNVDYQSVMPSGAPLRSEVRRSPAGPCLFLDGSPVYPFFGNTFVPGPNYGFVDKVPVNVHTFWVTNSSHNPCAWWKGPGRYDFDTMLDRYVENSLRDAGPDEYLMILVGVDAPGWWVKAHPEERATFEDGAPFKYGTTKNDVVSYSSTRYRNDASEALAALIKHCESSPFRDKIIAYWIVGGDTGEWQGWASEEAYRHGRMLDYSAPALAAFKDFLRREYPDVPAEKTPIPSAKERMQDSLGVFRDPAKSLPSIAYDDFYSNSVSDLLLALCGGAKRAMGDNPKPLGVYYGYPFEHATWRGRVQNGGHNAMRKVLDSGLVSFMISPISYGLRDMGDSAADMKPFASMRGHDVIPLMEDDSRTHLNAWQNGAVAQPVNAWQTTQTLRRNLGKAICRLEPLWMFPICGDNQFNSAAIIDDFKTIKRSGEFCVLKKVERHPEVAVVISESALKYMSYEKSNTRFKEERQSYLADGSVKRSPRESVRFQGELLSIQRESLARLGAPVDYLIAEDLSPAQCAQYKLWIFLNCFEANDKLLQAAERVKARGDCTLLWLFAPGLFKDHRVDLGGMERLTGFKLAMLPGPQTPLIDLTDLSLPWTAGLQQVSLGVPDERIYPLFHTELDKDASVVGRYRDSKLAALAVKRTGPSRAIFYGAYRLDPEMLRDLAADSGVHVFSRSLDTLYANDNFISFHARSSGKKHIELPRRGDVVDVFTRNVIARDVNSFDFDAPLHSSWLFHCGDANEFLNFK